MRRGTAFLVAETAYRSGLPVGIMGSGSWESTDMDVPLTRLRTAIPKQLLREFQALPDATS